MTRHLIPKRCPTCKNRSIKEALGKVWCITCGWDDATTAYPEDKTEKALINRRKFKKGKR